MNYTYMLRCADGSLYTGWTNDLGRRCRAHNAGRGGRYTRTRLPVTLVYAESHETKQAAMRREYALKQLTRAQKEALVASKENEWPLLMPQEADTAASCSHAPAPIPANAPSGQ